MALAHPASRLLCLALAFSACQFDASLPPATRAQCASDAQCPRGYSCVAELGLCRPKGARGPVLDATVDTAWARAGTVVTLTLTADSPLLQPPQVAAVLGTRQVPMLRDTAAEPELRYALTVTADMPEGVMRFVTDAFGQNGMGAQNPSLPPTVTVDLTPPRVDFAASSTSPAFAVANATVSLRAVFTEPVADGAGAQVTGAAGGATLNPDSNQNGVLAFTYHVAPGSPDGPLTVAVQSVTDLAGNPLEGSAALPGFTVDSVAPVLSAPGLQGRRYSAQPGHDRVQVPVHVDDATAEVTVWFGTHSAVAHDGDTVEFQLTTQDPEGSQTLVLTARDAAGNFAQDLWETLTVDLTAPALVGVPLVSFTLPTGCPLTQATALGTGMTASVAFNTDETLAAPPQLAAGPLTFTLVSGAAQVWQFGTTVTALATSGDYSLNATLVDDVGNSAVVPLRTLTVNTTPPAPLAATQLDGVLFRRVPWGSQAAGAGAHCSATAVDGTLPPGHALVFWSGPDPTNAVLLGRATATADGGFAAASLGVIDRTRVYAQHYDGACNVEGPTAALVRNVETIASLGGKVPGSATPNPHRFQARALPFDAGVTVETNPVELALIDGTVRTDTAGAQWHVAQENVVPTNYGASYYDSDRGRVVLLGNAPAMPNFSFNGTAWVREGESPPASGGAAVYDSVHHRAVLVSGGRTLSWDGTTWADLGVGPAIVNGQLFYDASRDVVIGVNSAGVVEWDGTTWTTVVAAPAAAGAFAGYDSTRHTVVLMGGKRTVGTTTTMVTSVMELSGTTWVTAPAMPAGRAGASAAFDSTRGKLVVVGGTMDIAGGLDLTTAEYDGTTWTVQSSLTAGYGWPPIIFHAGLSRMVSPGLTTKLWDGTRWTPWVDPAPGVPWVTGLNLTGLLAYDANRARAVFLASDFTTWEFNGTAWVGGTAGPPVRAQSALGYDPVSRRVLLFGGTTSTSLLAETWAWDGATWSQLAPSLSPSPRAGASMTVDLAAGRLRLFGGCAMTLSLSWVCTTPLNDLWQFTGSTWEPVAAAPAPGARWQAALVSDEARGRLVLAGGSGPFQNPTDLWELSGTTWADAGVNVGITTQVPSLYDRALGDTVLGSATWDGALHVAPEVLPVGPGTFDEARARGVAVETGGLRVWERALPSDRGPAHVAAFHCAELAEPTATITAVTPTFVTGADTATGPGARLQRFTGVVWATLASHSAPAAAPAALSATVTDPATLAALCVNGEMTFEASSAGGSDYAPSGGRLVGRRARLATDSVELTVRSRLP